VASFVLFGLLLAPFSMRSAAASSSSHAEIRAALASEQASDVVRAIAALEALGGQTAQQVLTALQERQLKVDGTGAVFIVPGRDLDTATPAFPDLGGAAPSPPVRAVPLNNAIRRELQRALARVRLTSEDLASRRRAAQELAARPTPEIADLLRTRLAEEQDDEVLDALRLGIAKLDLEDADPQRRIAALECIAELCDVSMIDTLRAMSEPAPDGTYRESHEDVRAAAATARSVLERRLALFNVAANTIYGLSLASVLLLAALGLAITFGLMGVINMAHGEMLMLGAYATFTAQRLFATYAPEHADAYLLLAVPLAFVSTAAMGVLLERTVIRRLYGRPLETLLATWGLSLILIQATRMLFGAQNVSVANPSWLSGGWDLMPNVVVPYSRVAVLLFTAVVVTFVWLVLQRTSLGLRVRAVTQNRDMAASLGIATSRVDMWTFALGSGVAGLGGVALSQLGNVGPELGQQHIIDSFMVVVLGGVGNIAGTVLGALSFGMANKFLEPITGAVLGKILILGLLILFIQRRPQGLFALKGRAAEN